MKWHDAKTNLHAVPRGLILVTIERDGKRSTDAKIVAYGWYHNLNGQRCTEEEAASITHWASLPAPAEGE